MEFGIDIASWQGYPNFPQLVKDGHSFMITKVTGEGNYVNPYWATNHDRARAAGMIPGVYDWVEPQNAAWQSGADAAKDYLRVVGARLHDSLLTVDFETPEWANGPLGRNIHNWMREYLYTLKELARKPVIVYLGPYFLLETGAKDWAWLGADFPLWLAAPGTGMMGDDSFWPATPKPFRRVEIHQHQWHARSGAIIGEFDRNRYTGNRAGLARLAATERDNVVIEPAPGKYTSYVNAEGNAIFVWNAGGQTDKILGTDIKDIGLTVVSKHDPDVQVSVSLQDQKQTGWHESPRQNRS